MIVSSKKQMYKLYEGGKFGNKLRTWSSLKELLDSEYAGNVVMRYKGVRPGGLGVYDVPMSRLFETLAQQKKEGVDMSLITFSEAAPDHRLILQGEVMRTEATGYYLFYSTEKTNMRAALSNSGQHREGCGVPLFLRGVMSPSSYDDLMELLEIYPDSVVEFGVYSFNLGACRGRNTIVWEVRNY